MITTVAATANLSAPLGVAADAVGNIYIVDSAHDEIKQYNLATGTTTILAGDGIRRIIPAMALSQRVRSWTRRRMSASTPPETSISRTPHNDRVRVINRQSSTITLFGVSIPAGDIQTVMHSTGCQPRQTALDGGGNLYVACSDAASGGGDTILKVNPAGSVTTFAGQKRHCELYGR